MAWYWHPWHHILLSELPSECVTASRRREEIKREKPLNEIALRLKLFKRARIPRALSQAIKPLLYSPLLNTNGDVLALHKRQCKRCPWGPGIYRYIGQVCIFTRQKKTSEWY